MKEELESAFPGSVAQSQKGAPRVGAFEVPQTHERTRHLYKAHTRTTGTEIMHEHVGIGRQRNRVLLEVEE